MTKKEALSVLAALGLTENQAKIYHSLLGESPATISTISQVTGLHRPAIYTALPGLIEIQLISRVIIGKREYFVSEQPSRLDHLIRDWQTRMSALIPDLTEGFRSKKKPIVKVYSGPDGIAAIFEDVARTLDANTAFYRYSAYSKIHKKKTRYLPRIYRERMESLQGYVITNEDYPSHQMLGRSVKVIRSKEFKLNDNVTLMIYGDRVAYIDYNTEQAMIIENTALASFHRQIFLLLFRQL